MLTIIYRLARVVVVLDETEKPPRLVFERVRFAPNVSTILGRHSSSKVTRDTTSSSDPNTVAVKHPNGFARCPRKKTTLFLNKMRFGNVIVVQERRKYLGRPINQRPTRRIPFALRRCRQISLNTIHKVVSNMRFCIHVSKVVFGTLFRSIFLRFFSHESTNKLMFLKLPRLRRVNRICIAMRFTRYVANFQLFAF